MKQPEEKKVQIIVFGPGYGESTLVHLGSRNWVIVDTCNIKRKPAVLVYLEKIGVEVKNEVKLIVATHWHQDHLSGIEKTLKNLNRLILLFPLLCQVENFGTAQYPRI